MDADVFKEQQECKHDNLLTCVSVKRIKYILCKSNFNNTNSIHTIHNVFVKYAYTNTKLIDDFNHIKYNHYVDDNNLQFAKMYNYFTNGNHNMCDIIKCKCVDLHYRDRSKFSTTYFTDNNIEIIDQLILDLVARIHVYFIHSYHTNRLTLKEINAIDEQLKLYV
eukprot:317163_1